MKQLLFLLLFPCLALAQYQGNANQKITLGEQTTADGLVFRGVASIDTVTATSKITRANKQDTSAYILLDTVTNLLWHYKIGSNAWTQAAGGVTSFSAGTTGLSPSSATTGAVTLGGTLAVANGGTGQNTLALNKVMVGNGTSGVLTPTNLHWDNSNSRLGIGGVPASTNDVDVIKIGSTNVSFALRNDSSSQLFQVNSGFARWLSIDSRVGGKRYDIDNGGFRKGAFRIINNSNNNNVLFIDTSGFLGLSITDPTEKLHVVGNARISGLANAANPVNVQVDVNGVLVRTSSIDIKEDVQSLPYGLNEVMLLQPSKFSYIDKYKYGEGYDIGFIAQDVNNVIPEAVGTGIESDIFMDSVKLIPVLTKAIQEQQAFIKALEQRILILENK